MSSSSHHQQQQPPSPTPAAPSSSHQPSAPKPEPPPKPKQKPKSKSKPKKQVLHLLGFFPHPSDPSYAAWTQDCSTDPVYCFREEWVGGEVLEGMEKEGREKEKGGKKGKRRNALLEGVDRVERIGIGIGSGMRVGRDRVAEANEAFCLSDDALHCSYPLFHFHLHILFISALTFTTSTSSNVIRARIPSYGHTTTIFFRSCRLRPSAPPTHHNYTTPTMDTRNRSLSRSSSMPILVPSPEQTPSPNWQYGSASLWDAQPAHHLSMNPPSYQNFSSNTNMWGLTAQHFPSQSTSGVHSPDSDTIVKLSNTCPPTAKVSPKSPDSEATVTPDRQKLRHGSVPMGVHASLTNPSIHHHGKAHTQAELDVLPSPWNPTFEAQRHARAPSGAESFMTDSSYAMSMNADWEGGMSHAHGHTLRPDPFQALQIPAQTTLHQRRMSSRMSSFPTIPSPLAPRRMGEEQRGSDTSGFVNPAPSQKFEYGGLLSAPPTFQRVGQEESSNMFGLHQRKVDGAEPSLQRLPGYGSGVGHARQNTDPFVDDTTATQRFDGKKPSLFTHHSPNIPSNPPSFATPIGTRPPPPPIFPPQPTTPTQSPLPIPPLPSPSNPYHPHQHHPTTPTPPTAARQSWIQTAAHEIVHLSHALYAASHAYTTTPNATTYLHWQTVSAAYAHATDLEARKEERRNLFLGRKGMAALKTGVLGDASAGCVEAGEKLFGFRMAFLERVCSLVREHEMDEDGEEEEGITREMLRTLSLEEKKALRAHLVARLVKK
ncbi:hypothetical protein BDW02DRAFT_650776 [Decorospora gaudefroyi]|uniref:Uncharacterized protein n=1 Tax=Decorospora gaudefroyi TaxID=184978 RepID=A0A6A5K0N9_9PLEO|nr:hypothetical protein BDW02DRAFT_650776 [Decorospora gaudefroyi]